MQANLPRRCCALLLVPTLLLGVWATQGGLAHLGLDGWNVAKYQREKREADEAIDRLETRSQAIRCSIALKEQIQGDLLAGHLTLVEAASCIDSVSVTPLNLEWFQGETREERLCWYVIWQVCPIYQQDQDQFVQIAVQLQNELADHIRQHGSVCLPPPDPQYLLQAYRNIQVSGIAAGCHFAGTERIGKELTPGQLEALRREDEQFSEGEVCEPYQFNLPDYPRGRNAQ